MPVTRIIRQSLGGGVRAIAALSVAVLVALFGFTACSSSDTGTDEEQRVFADAEDGAFPVTVDHAYGETTIEDQAQRVVVVGWAGADLAVQLGTL